MTMKELLARRHFERGRQFELQERIDEAMEAYRQACDLEADVADPFFSLIRLEASRGRHEVALELLDTAIGIEPESAMYEWRAYVSGRLRRYEQALADYPMVVAEGEPSVRVNLGRMLLALGRYSEAEAELKLIDDASAGPLLDALPRYREFAPAERLDDMRAVRYLFGATVVLGTRGARSDASSTTRYLLLTPAHIAFTMRRFQTIAAVRGWAFDGVVGEGSRDAPLAEAFARMLGVPQINAPRAGRLLVVSAVVTGAADSIALRSRWGRAGADVMHFAMGLVPDGDPNREEPDVVGFVNRCSVTWHQVEPYARLVPDDEIEAFDTEAKWPGFKVGPAFIDPNVGRVAQTLHNALAAVEADDGTQAIADFYAQHPQARACRFDEGHS